MSLSSSSSKVDKTGKTGKNWTSQVYFNPNADTQPPIEEITAANLLKEMRNWVEGEEMIEDIYVYKCPVIPGINITELSHQFVVFKTWWWLWSIEKNDQGITVQRGKKLSSVRDRYRGEARKKDIEELNRDEGRMKMRDFVDWLESQGELYKAYHILNENCQHFAKRVFDNFAKSKTHSIL